MVSNDIDSKCKPEKNNKIIKLSLVFSFSYLRKVRTALDRIRHIGLYGGM